MMNNSDGLPNDYLAIDTNVFGNIANTDEDGRARTLELLDFLKGKKTRLLTDKGKRIQDEYECHINTRKFRKQHARNRKLRRVLKYWMHLGIRTRIDAENSEIWPDISNEMPHDEVDATFVCVAFIKDRALITNDHRDILSKRETLKRIAERSGLMEADVISSDAAHAKMPQSTTT